HACDLLGDQHPALTRRLLFLKARERFIPRGIPAFVILSKRGNDMHDVCRRALGRTAAPAHQAHPRHSTRCSARCARTAWLASQPSGNLTSVPSWTGSVDG